ncbi:AarF/ABC1/UbiB kinase family protein [Rhodobacter sp. CZR27]|uniref:ABC1 kinase family protein n=1 Tax=Rhodobacter sp. CZR27 TaxID=2033869 RepID=UPI000BBEBADA|nr:AarF/ABC1/UbiB kinase family protein [Rhodobacter sp. CZR27]
MTASRPEPRPLAVPSGRLSRLARFGGLASGIAGNVALNGARQIAQGRRPVMSDLILTPANVARLAEQLAQMRGAAMKVGQLLSMDAGEMLPPELADILGRLRAEAHYMPPPQLRSVLTAAWGADWHRRFRTFNVRPIAAASIGQVHRAVTREGEDLAVKVQYPGVRRSIDSDVDNVAALMRLSGLVPKGLDLGAMLDEAKRQLHEEADYEREGRCLSRFAALLGGDARFRVPDLHVRFTTRDVLAMGHVGGGPVEDLASAPQAERDRVTALLIGLMFRELFEFRLMQTDPNFANYRHDAETGQVVLLDFGATREVSADLSEGYRGLLRAGLAGDAAATRRAVFDMGFISDAVPEDIRSLMLEMLEISMEPLRARWFDFGGTDVAMRLRDLGMAIGERREIHHLPPVETFYIQRKFGGMYLLASRLRARVAIRELIEPHL